MRRVQARRTTPPSSSVRPLCRGRRVRRQRRRPSLRRSWHSRGRRRGWSARTGRASAGEQTPGNTITQLIIISIKLFSWKKTIHMQCIRGKNTWQSSQSINKSMKLFSWKNQSMNQSTCISEWTENQILTINLLINQSIQYIDLNSWTNI